MTIVDALIYVVILSLVGYRVAMFIMLDAIFERPRDALHDFLTRGHRRIWILQLITCIVCISVWLAAGLTLVTWLCVDDLPIPVWVWLATSSGIIATWKALDPEHERRTMLVEVKDRK